MQDINRSIASAGFRGFELREKPGAKYVYELVRDLNGKKVVVDKNLSEGERHFIAFLYFYHIVMGSQSDEGKVEDKIVIIDDPVSSMDSSSLFVVAALTREMIAVCYNNYSLDEENRDDHIRQFFCMTHNPYFFREITYNRVPDYECVSFFEIKKDGKNQTSIIECDDEDTLAGGGKINRSPVKNSYDALWDEYMRTENPDTLMMVIRQILEYYFVQMVGYQNANLRRDLLDKHPEDFEKDDYTAASAMIAMINVGATGFNDGLYYDSSAADVKQLRTVFEKIFKVMQQEQHYNMMTRRVR
jgi:wobble nucleotide-excising tRNase